MHIRTLSTSISLGLACHARRGISTPLARGVVSPFTVFIHIFTCERVTMVFSPARGVVLVDGRSAVVHVVDGAGEGLHVSEVVVVDVPEVGLPAAALYAWLALTLRLSF